MNPCSLLLTALTLALLPGCAVIRKAEPAMRSEASFSLAPSLGSSQDSPGTAATSPLVNPKKPKVEPLALLPLQGDLELCGSIGFINHEREWVTWRVLDKNQGEAYYAVVILDGIIAKPSLLQGPNLDPASRKTRRNELAGVILTASDQNADVWLTRVFNNKAMAETTRNILNDLFVGTGAVVARAHAGLTTGLNVASIAFGKTVENFDKSYFANQTYLAMESVIRNRRKQLADAISVKLKGSSYDDYPITDVLRDIQQLDEACSLKGGLRELQRKADEASPTEVVPHAPPALP